ncbi:MAG: hypothetical protein D6760_04180 [Deltaproteobacteria bacterium]|nr:MAG: hypothetical protein D6760_04180 [Deltaproteobacteria bacterium]
MKSVVLTLLLVSAVACGVKTAPRPPEDTAARPPRAVRAVAVPGGRVRLEWKRPEHSVDGRRLDDLARFAVERSTRGGPYERIGTVDVLDPNKLRPRSSYHYVDTPSTPLEELHYRVRAIAADGQEGVASQPVAVQSPGGTEDEAGDR